MDGIGKVLQQAREEQGISTNELQERTHIREWIIEAIEAENFAAIPGGMAYVKGFVRRLCDELQLDYVGLTKSQVPQHPVEALPIARHESKPPFNWLTFAGVCLMLMAFFLAAIYWYYWLPRVPVPPPLVITPPPIIEAPVEPPVLLPPSEKPGFVFVGEQGGRSVFAIENWPMELVIVVREESCWVMANADNAGNRSVLLTAGQSWQVTATESLLLRLGRARVVDIKVNGQLLPRQESDVKDFTFTKVGP